MGVCLKRHEIALCALCENFAYLAVKSSFFAAKNTPLAFRADNKYTYADTFGTNIPLTPAEPMTRFLCFTLTLLLALPAFAQETPAPAGMELPQDPAYLMQLREGFTFQLQDIQRVLAVLNPSDVRTRETLEARQAELTQQLRDVVQQLQSAPQQGMGRNAGMMQPSGMGMPPNLPVQQQWAPGGMGGMMPPGVSDPNLMNMNRGGLDAMTGLPPAMQPSMMQPPMPMMQQPAPIMPIPPQWAAQNPAWGGTAPDTALLKELTEVKQTLDALRREVSELKEMMKMLETRLQLLNRDMILSERLRENEI